MPIPEDILKVERPKNTIVIAYGKNKDHYAVRERVGCKYVNGRRVPINGPTIGHIVNHLYQAIDKNEPEPVSQTSIDLKDWANVELCDQLFKDIQPELFKVYERDDAIRIYCISVLRVCDYGVHDCKLKDDYEESFLSELYPDVALSKNTVSNFINNLGKGCSKIRTFMRNRASTVKADNHLLIDGTLKTDNSVVNSFSDFSRKVRVKGTQDISVLYAFDLEKMEPVCSKCFPGNMIDSVAYEEFIKENGITKGIIVADKGFPEKSAEEQFKSHPDLHYLNPIKRNSKLLKANKLLKFSGILKNNAQVAYKKAKCEEQDQCKWLYSFWDAKRAGKEQQDWMTHAHKSGSFDFDVLHKKRAVFGTVVLECDLDLDPETVYKAYSKRWEIEVFMRYYKTACEFDDTREHDDYSVIGSEFCDFLSSLLTCRLINKFDSVHLLDKMTYKEIMHILTRAKKARVEGNDWQMIRINVGYRPVLEELGLLPKTEENSKKSEDTPKDTPKRKRGRPRKKSV